MRNKQLKIFNDYLNKLLREALVVLRKEVRKANLNISFTDLKTAIVNDSKNILKNNEFEYNAYLETLERDNADKVNKLLYKTFHSAFAMKDVPSSYKNKFKYKNEEITPKQYFNIFYFENKQPRCPFCGKLLDRNKNDLLMTDIEHLFPQSDFPQLILCINNYIPCCRECNTIKRTSFFKTKHEFLEDLKILNMSFSHPMYFVDNVSIDFANEKTILSDSQILVYYGLNQRLGFIKKQVYNNLFNIIKHHKINSPEGLESFLECCLSSNMQEMISDFSINNYPKIWNDFLDYVLYDYNNLSALWDELKEYNKLAYFS